MHANREIMYWHSNKEWYYFDEKEDKIKLTDKAPPRAVESFKKWRNNKNKHHF